jgi:serine/threonine-protein kinase
LSQKDQYFSRVHFLIELNPPLCRIIDLQSRNGTFVNGKRVSAAQLKEGDLIRTGKTVIRIRMTRSPDEVEPATLPATAEQDLPSRVDKRLQSRLVAPPRGLPPSEHLPPDYREKIEGREQPIAGYSIVDELGRGGMGVVYLAISHSDQSVVALKSVDPAATVSPNEFQKFRREALILRELDHPHIVRFRDVGESGEHVYFAMDFAPGVDGRKLIRQRGQPLPVARAVSIVCQLLRALEHAHGLGYVHRDIKPSNLMIHQVSRKDFVWLTDFGLARTYQSSRFSGLTLTGDMGGTTKYMPPEQILSYREAPPAGDQYASAATLYKLLTNANVYDFPPELARQIFMILTEPIVPIDSRRDDIPPGLAQAIHRALSRDPQERFASVTDFRNAIECYAQ